ncbi:MAG TPA: thermonuclease family protein [Cyclobacteriaceae bacterium]|jgi:endonuclease YncB( thermonuclease family)|nr:thermonuclease family protein [Cyclobacteriaceae bacterium]
MKFKILALLSFCILTVTNFNGRVTRVMDGDTVEVIHNGAPERVRLYGIDCPEIGHQAGEASQAFGQKAKEFTTEFCRGQEVKIETHDNDKYGRTIGVVTRVSDGLVLNEELLKAGFAWHYKQYDKNDKWQQMEDEARQSRKGLWVDSQPMAPWDYRHKDK